ncbi:Flp pilus assembly complex ATPase component TadA [Acidithiobacillus ferrivorans]|nr:Flp pilus assembly complex ATPase component TadA [Acidithiobacillus ferrivorans]
MTMHTQEPVSESRRRLVEKLKRELGIEILHALNDPEVVEVMLNSDGVIWEDRIGVGMRPIGNMYSSDAESLLTTIASITGKEIHDQSPILECHLPLHGERFEGLVPPAVENASFAIRKRAGKIFTLDDYVQHGIMTAEQADDIRDAVKNRDNILVVGGTGCFAKGHPILMHDGSVKPVENVVVGDNVMGPDGKERIVKDVHSGLDHMVEVVPMRGASFIVNQGHSLAVINMETGERYRITVMEWTRLPDREKKNTVLYSVIHARPSGGFMEHHYYGEDIRVVRSIGLGAYYGFEVDHPDHLFVDGNFMVQGNSGKSTLVNGILDYLGRHAAGDQRIVIIEDVPELQCAAPNKVNLLGSQAASLNTLLRATMRLRPDRIVVGEVRDAAALTMLKAWNTGHPGGVCTIHANSPEAALIRLDQLCMEAGVPSQGTLIQEAVDVVIFIRKNEVGKRLVERIWRPKA